MQFLSSALAFAAVVFASPMPDRPPPPSVEMIKTPVLVGDGSPVQNYLYKQITTQINCNHGPCELARSDIKERGIGWSGGASAAGWISGGFEVTQSVQTGSIANCQSSDDTKVICVFWRTAFTAYKVHDHAHVKTVKAENGEPIGDDYWIHSPNKSNLGSDYICARDDECHNEDYEFWGNSKNTGEIKGGPQEYPDDDKPWI